MTAAATLDTGICCNLIGAATKLCHKAARRVAADSAKSVFCGRLGDATLATCDEHQRVPIDGALIAAASPSRPCASNAD